MINNSDKSKDIYVDGGLRKKVVHIITRLDKGGSAEDTLVTVSRSNSRVYDLFLICGLSKESKIGVDEEFALKQSIERAQNNGVKIIDLPSLVRKISPLNDLISFWKLVKFFKNKQPDIVHTHTSKAGIVGRWAAFFAGVPKIIHTPHGHVFHGYFNAFVTKIFILVERLSARITSKVIAVSDREKIETLEQGVGSNEQLLTIYSGVELERFYNRDVNVLALKEKLQIPADYKIIGTIGRLVPIKGYSYLLEAAQEIVAKFPKTCVLMLGDGELKEEFVEQVEAAGIGKNVIFLGWRADVDEIVYLFDLFVLPSLNEGMGKVLLEVMAAAIPIVASRVGGIVDLVKNGKNGLLVSPANAKELSAAIIRLLDNEKFADKLGKTGQEMVYPDFDASVMIEKIEAVYEETN